MDSQTLRIVLIGTVSGLAAYFTFERSGLVSALIVLFTVGWIIYRFSTAKSTWNTLGILLNPFMAVIVAFLIGFSYSALKGDQLAISLAFGVIAAVFGAVLSRFTYTYWNIGS